jgi:tetratricopeptide (TPR) repeat protein
MVSYFEAGRICDYIAQRWGNEALLGMIHSFANRKTTAEAIQDNLHESAEAFDKDFGAWLEQQTGPTVRHFDDWKKGLKAAYEDLEKGKADEAIRQGIAIRDYYPDYVGNDSDYELIMQAYLGKKDKAAAIQALERYRDEGGTNIAPLRELARLEQEAGQASQAEKTLTKLNYIYPESEETHRRLGTVLLDKGDSAGAIREFQAVLILKPSDTAESHYDLAKALCAAHRNDEAKNHVLMALEAAPDFKPAQQLLLQLSQ